MVKKRPTEILLKTNRYVKRVGYEHEFKTVLARLLFESQPKTFQEKYHTVDIDVAQELVRFGEEEVGLIIGAHKKFEEYRKIRTEWRSKIDRLPGSWEIVQKAEREMVYQTIKGVIGHHMRDGAVRKLWCGQFQEKAGDKALHEWWRGPWYVHETKMRWTGSYYSGCGAGYDGDGYELPDLGGRTPVRLYVVRYSGWSAPDSYRNRGWQNFMIMTEDACAEDYLKDRQDVSKWAEDEAEEAELTKTA